VKNAQNLKFELKLKTISMPTKSIKA